jgi:putative ABC transport system substrate-binding protein
MRRRQFLSFLAGATAWPFATGAQQPAVPVIGFLDGRSPNALTDRLRGFRAGLKEAGFTEGENLAIAYRWAENQSDRLSVLAAELVRRPVALIVASGGPGVVSAAKAATTTIPVVFILGADPVRLGLVASLARPGGNLTGVNFVNRELAAKQLELLRELVPALSRVAVLINPANKNIAEAMLQEVGPAARTMGLQIQPVRASTSSEIDAAFAEMARERPDGLIVTADPFLAARRAQVVLLAGRHGVPAIYSGREWVQAGGLITYGSDITDAYRQMGVYAGRILKGTNPADLPVMQADKFELIINLKAVKALGLEVPARLLALADEVID